MIIYGSRTISSTCGQGEFTCPLCKTRRAYSEIKNTRYFTLYFIPLFPMYAQGQHVQCHSCGEGFAVEVLHQGPAALTQIHPGLEDMRRAMLLVMAEAKRTDPGQLDRLCGWCHQIGLQATTVALLNQELSMAQQASMTFAVFAPARLGHLTPQGRTDFVLAAKQLLCGPMTPQRAEENLLRSVAFHLQVAPRNIGLH
jgi:hypothetical protein